MPIRNTVLNEVSNPSVSGKPQRVPHATHHDRNADSTLTLRNLDDNICDVLNKIKTKKISNVVIDILNIYSFPGKFDSFKTIISANVDVMIIVETKLDDSYSTSQFCMHGYSKPFRGDRCTVEGF